MLRLPRWIKAAIALVPLLGLLCLLGWPYLAIAATSQSTMAQNVLQDFEQRQQQQQLEQQQLEQQQQQFEQRQQQVQERQQAVEQATERIKQAEQSALGDLTDLQDTLLRTEGALADSQYRLEVAAQYLKGLEANLVQSQQTYQKQRNSTVARLQVLQRQQRLQGWAVLLESDSIGAFLQRRYYLKKLYESDRTRLNNLTNQATRLKQQQEQIEEQKNGIALLRQQQLVQKSGLEKKGKQQELLIQRLKDNRAALEAAQVQLQRDSENLTELIQELIAKRSASAGFLGGGPLRVPVAAPISSPFGWRVHPVLGTERFHSGIDFAVDYGTPIGAAAGGVVIYADWYGGYGNAVIVDHGDGITTLYAHNNELAVSPGQTVQSGQVVSLSGSTGLSTGPHLHFEVRQNGEPVDPMEYL